MIELKKRLKKPTSNGKLNFFTNLTHSACPVKIFSTWKITNEQQV